MRFSSSCWLQRRSDNIENNPWVRKNLKNTFSSILEYVKFLAKPFPDSRVFLFGLPPVLLADISFNDYDDDGFFLTHWQLYCRAMTNGKLWRRDTTFWKLYRNSHQKNTTFEDYIDDMCPFKNMRFYWGDRVRTIEFAEVYAYLHNFYSRRQIIMLIIVIMTVTFKDCHFFHFIFNLPILSLWTYSLSDRTKVTNSLKRNWNGYNRNTKIAEPQWQRIIPKRNLKTRCY